MTRRGLLRLISIAVIVALMVVYLPGVAGEYLVSVAQEPVKADIIFALGGDVGDRVDRSVRLYRDGFAPRLLLSGLEEAPKGATRAYLNWREQYLLDAGIPLNAILIDDGAKNSWQEATNALALMKVQNWRQILVVSDAPHLRRLSWIWGKVFEGSGIEFRLVAADPDRWDVRHWWRDERTCVFVFNEWLKLVYYKIKY